MQKWFDNVVDKSGVAQPNATVRVTLTATGVLASIFSDDGVTAKANPIQINGDPNGYYEFYAANGKYTLTFGGSGITAASITNVQLQDGASDLMGWALAQAFRIVSAIRDVNEAITSANIVWPDGATGVLTSTVLSTALPGAIDAWTATYVGTTTKTITQPTVTRDAGGAVTSQPAITIV